ncbi:MAG: GldG family protein, partial [Steroidobacteraceae bacterium]|nr:GldG family protein [Steroidobacteraceae bacterium]
MRQLRLSGLALLLLAVLFVAVTALSQRVLRGARLDLTANKLYTLSDGTLKIIAGLREPVNLYFYYTSKTAEQVPAIKNYGTRVREFLQELAARSDGKLRLRIIDPEPSSEEEDRAAEAGIRAVPLGASGEALYFGLAGTNSTDGRAAIEFFDLQKEPFLEYDVAKLIYQLGNPKLPVVGWLSGLPMTASFDPSTGRPREAWIVLGQAEQLFDVRILEPNVTRIDNDVDVLVIVHPKNLPPAVLYAIDQYALRGGRILLFVDPSAEGDTAGADPTNPFAAITADRKSTFAPLLEAWGVQFDNTQVLGDA